MLAVAHGNHQLCLTNSHTGKLVHQLDCSKYSASEISCLGWGATFTERKVLNKRLQNSTTHITIDDVISRNPLVQSIDVPSNLPLDLAFIDIEANLPKLSPLSSGGLEYVGSVKLLVDVCLCLF